ncbi:MAG: hypothetical protein PSX80_11495 [bacterium]|nr:hypothetical protein [bacterium]
MASETIDWKEWLTSFRPRDKSRSSTSSSKLASNAELRLGRRARRVLAGAWKQTYWIQCSAPRLEPVDQYDGEAHEGLHPYYGHSMPDG